MGLREVVQCVALELVPMEGKDEKHEDEKRQPQR
jgi:hypothetical protein